MTLDEIRGHLTGIVGKQPWAVTLGFGSFLTLEFGGPVPTPEGRPHGQWHLWIYGAAWRIERGEKIMAASEDDRSTLSEDVKVLDGKILRSAKLAAMPGDVTLEFESDLRLRTFAVYSQFMAHWFLYLPQGKVLTVGPGSVTLLEDSDSAREVD